MDDFDPLWRAAVRYRRTSRELEPLVRELFDSFGNEAALGPALERLLVYLTMPEGRTDANCTVTDAFVAASESRWRGSSLDAILEDMGATLHDAIHAEPIARTFESTPEQLLARLRER